MDLKKLKIMCRITSNRFVVIKAFKIGLLVGTLLNFINQGDIIIAGQWGQIHWFKLVLTYCVPFGVSLYTALSMGMKFRPHTRAKVDAFLLCASCAKTHHHAKKNHILPQCPRCLENTEWEV